MSKVLELLEEIHKHRGGTCPVCNFTVCTDDCQLRQAIAELKKQLVPTQDDAQARQDDVNAKIIHQRIIDNHRPKKQPEPTEFTKEIRAMLAISDAFDQTTGRPSNSLTKHLLEACIKFDQQAAEIKQLKERLESLLNQPASRKCPQCGMVVKCV